MYKQLSRDRNRDTVACSLCLKGAEERPRGQDLSRHCVGRQKKKGSSVFKVHSRQSSGGVGGWVKSVQNQDLEAEQDETAHRTFRG